MSKIIIEAFLPVPPGSGGAGLKRLLKETEKEYGDKVEIIVYEERNELYEEYNLSALPALIVGDLVRFIGVCPDKESMTTALKETGAD